MEIPKSRIKNFSSKKGSLIVITQQCTINERFIEF